MAVNLTNLELETFAKNGIGTDAIQSTVNAYRAEGLDDNAIRVKIDDKLGVFALADAEKQYGAENVARARAATAEIKAEQDSEKNIIDRPAYILGKFFSENPVGRAATSVLQGANKGNPFVQLASAVPGAETINDRVIEPENALERALEMGAEFATPAGVGAKAGQMAAKGIKGTGRLASGLRAILKPAAMPIEYAGAAGAGALTGAVDPESTAGKILAGVAGGLTGAGLAGVLNRATNYVGKSALRDALGDAATQRKYASDGILDRIMRAGADVEDVNFGKLSKDRMDTLNQLRDMDGLIQVKNGDVIIPSDRVKHLYDSRSIDPNYTAQKLSETLDDALYGKNSVLSRQADPNKSTIAFINMLKEPRNIAYVGERNGNNIVVSGQNMRGQNTTPRRYSDLDGRPTVPPKLTNQSQLQGPAGQVDDIISSSTSEVKLGDLAADNKSYKALRKGISASDDIADRLQYEAPAAVLKNQEDTIGAVKREMNSFGGTTLQDKGDAIKGSYADFMKDHGATNVPGAQALLKRHPDLQPYINDAVTKGIYNSRGKPTDSFAVLAEASRRIKMDLRDRMINSSSKLQDKAIASSALDKLLDGKFSGREYLDKSWRVTRRRFDILDELDNLNLSEMDNVGKKLLTSKFKSEFHELFPGELSENVFKILRESAKKSQRLSKLAGQAEQKTGLYGNTNIARLLREALETPGSMVGVAGDWINSAIGNATRTRRANALLNGNLTPDRLNQSVLRALGNSIGRPTLPRAAISEAALFNAIRGREEQ